MTYRRTSVLVLVLLSFFMLGTSSTGTAQGLIETTASYRFGELITLTAAVPDMGKIFRAAVFVRPESSETAKVFLADLLDANNTLVTVELDPGQLPLSAFERLYYWWQIDLDSGEVLSTQTLELEYLDDRYDWDARAGDKVSLLWHDRTLSEGQAILETTEMALSQIEQSFALIPTSEIKVVLYNSPQELQSALALVGLPQTAGHAEPASGVIYLSANVGAEGLVQLERLLPHELVHLLLNQGPGAAVEYPPWLAEGMATLVEGTPSLAGHNALELAIQTKSLLRFTDLCSAFPAASDGAQLAYAQSGSFLRYMVDIYGVGGINKLLEAYQEGASCTGAVQRVYQRSLDQLQSEWEATLLVPERDRLPTMLSGGAAVLIILTIAYFVFRHRAAATRSAAARMDGHDRPDHI